MRKANSRAPRAVKSTLGSPLLTRALLARQVPSLRTAAPAGAARTPLISRGLLGFTLNRFRDGCELVYPDGRKHTAAGPWSLLGKMIRGGAK